MKRQGPLWLIYWGEQNLLYRVSRNRPFDCRPGGKRLVPVSLELGGKSPLIVFDDCDYEAAVKTALGQYDNAGQVCVAGTRILVQETIADQFLNDMKNGAKQIVLGDPRNPETDVGPLITREHLQRVQGFVDRAIAAGVTVVYGGKVSEQLGGL